MNIAFVSAAKGWGGVKTWYLAFAEGLAARGHRVRVYGKQPVFVEAAKRRVGHGELVDFGADLNPLTVRWFYQTFRREAIDVVIINVGKDLTTAGVAAKLAGIPVVQRIGLPNDIALKTKTRLLHAWIRPVFLCPCRFIAEGFVQSLPYVRAEDVHVILNGKSPTSQPLHVHTPRRFLCTQQLSDDKGHETLLRACALLDTTPDWELHVWGTGRSEARLKGLASELGLDAKVFWHGFSDNVMPAVQEADIFLLASLSEGLPNTLLEAMSAGLLPLCRQVGGVGEVIPADLAAWTLPYAADAAAFRDSMQKALALSDEALLALRERARTACREGFALDRQVAELEEWLRSLVE